jgi:hypothetical protein
MIGRKVLIRGAVAAAAMVLATPASAQFFLKSKEFAGQPVRGDEPGIGQPMPDATPAELRASLVWNMRAALNVAALQCQFEPTLLAVTNYNAMLVDHKAELKGAFDTLAKYYTRVGKTKAKGQSMLDQFGTRTYSSFVTVGGQFGFCQTAASIGRDAVFRPRGQFGDLAALRMAELRASLLGAYGEQALPRYASAPPVLPRLDPVCWTKKGDWNPKKCGPLVWPPSA